MSSSILSSQGMAMALATAMAALSGTLIVLSLCLHKSHSSISSVGKKRETTEKKKRRKRVHFAEDVPTSTEDLRRKKGSVFLCSSPPATGAPPPCLKLEKSQ
ncbi:uncharacterized protein LOC111013136, partial [Momordica charantia]|uniref:Uncharacterized protein LOC111013136 n=1 Tax=Momordica charantia TaxID=3673 RepID=A0A6J1CNP2_MOMCH